MKSPFVFIIFGATGDLALHKLIPALYSLFKQGKLGDEFFIIGFARRPFADQEYAHMLGDELEYHKEDQWAAFSQHLYYQQGNFNEEQGYTSLIARLNEYDTKMGACITRIFYLATPPDNYASILDHLQKTKLSEGCGQGSEKWTRLAIEKPFGKDLETARTLDTKLAEIFEEKQIFRVDHYLGKETVQNIIAFRFANSIFEPVWNNEFIDHVQITWMEKKGVGTRGAFFDGVGMLRDVAQNHLMQLLAAVAMEQPQTFSKEGVRDARAAAIRAITCPTCEEVSQTIVRGQYAGYLAEKNVKENSLTETFVAMRLFVTTERFKGVPFYLRAGKKVGHDVVDIKIVFKQTCHILFKEAGCPEVGNVLTIRIQPDEGISFRIIAKKPTRTEQTTDDAKFVLSPIDMDFSYHKTFGSHGVDAYERVLLDIMEGDQMLFNRSDELESSWKLISAVMEGWSEETRKLPEYTEESDGPDEAMKFIEKDGRKWL